MLGICTIYMSTWTMQLHFFNVSATTSVVAKICKTQIVLNFTHFNPKKHINPCKNVQIYQTVLQMNSNSVYTVYVEMIFLFFFFLSLSSVFLLTGPLTLTSLSLFSFFFSLRINPLSSPFLSSHKLPLPWPDP